MKRQVLVYFYVLALPLLAYCQQLSRIELVDGSVINAEIVSFSNGVYTVNTSSFGQIKLKEAQVYKIHTANAPQFSPPAPSPFEGNNLFDPGANTHGQAMMSDPANTALITGLATDPRIQSLTQDPQIAEAAKSGDIQALMKSKKFMDLVNDPQVQQTLDRLKK